jgi:mRNA interferase MazF
MDEIGEFRRGDIVLVNLPYITDPSMSKERPSLIIQNDTGNRFSTNLIVAAISSRIPDREYPFHYWIRVGFPEAEGTGLEKDSVVHTEIILTIPKVNVIKHLGRFNEIAMRFIDECLRVSLSL